MEDLDKTTNRRQDGFDLMGLLLDYLSKWKWFALSLVLCAAIGYVILSTIVPVYEVSASVYLNDNDMKGNGTALIFSGDMLTGKDYLDETQIEILKSRNNLIKIVDSLDLAYSYYKVGTLRDEPIYGTNAIVARLDSVSLRGLSSPIEIIASKKGSTYSFDIETNYRGEVERKTVRTDSLPLKVELSHGSLELSPSKATSRLDGKLKIEVSNPTKVAARLSANLSIGFARNSSTILIINYQTPVVEEGADIINTLINIYNQDIIADKNRSALQAEEFIVERLALIHGELQNVEREVEDYRREKKITDISTETGMYLSQTSETDAEIAQVDMKQQLVSDVEKIVNNQDAYAPIPQVIDDAALNSMIEAYNKKLAQRAALLDGGTEDNPIVQNMQDDLARAKNEIYRGIENVKHGLSIQKRNLTNRDRRIEGRISNIPTYERELTGIFREQRIKDNIYNFLLEKREEIALQKTLATPTARLIDDPLGSGPVSPDRMMFIQIVLCCGLLIPAGLIFIRRLVFPIFKDKDELERATNVPILGEIGKNSSKEAFVLGDNVTTPISEMFRLVRNNVQFLASGSGSKVLLVTSSISGEGKTFVAANLALSFALTGKKTLVIGADIRRPVLARNLSVDNNRGLTTYLSGQELDIDSLIVPSSRCENLFVMPAGPVPPNPNELLLGGNFGGLIEKVRGDYDYVVVDTAPIGVVSDTLLISQFSDVQLFVLRADYSTRRSLKIVHQAIASGRLKSCALVLNGVDVNVGSYSYRKYGRYGRYDYMSENRRRIPFWRRWMMRR
ncbi:MAG: polysaccharide biosynthesis tyrosine autokinase [Muribaculaceae bacterium]|nr:polysaccharide biosynthesis tyrosine autokinase [Muribaculaceae bacterium]